jgi:hypothetical protein
MMASVLRIDSNGVSSLLPFVTSSDSDFDEKWIQKQIDQYPELVPAELLGSPREGFVSICREFTLTNGKNSVYLDVFGVTTSGTPVLIECKLWRNPQARREVIGQILEYSALLQGMSYEDVVARCRSRLGADSADPILDRARQSIEGLDEARFVDRFSSCLETGEFILIIAGDGIRSDVRRVVDQLSRGEGAFRRLGLLELNVAQGSDGEKVIVPLVPFQAEQVQLAGGSQPNSVPEYREGEVANGRRSPRARDPELAATDPPSGINSSRQLDSTTPIRRNRGTAAETPFGSCCLLRFGTSSRIARGIQTESACS